MELLAATGNKNKLAEIRAVAQRFGISIVSPEEMRTRKNLEPLEEVAETGSTYRANAELKACAYARWADMTALGDDSGLEVVALENRPGLYSARYAGVEASDREKVAKLLRELEEAESRSGSVTRQAFFVCALALASPTGELLHADARLEGEVLRAPRGSKGFGYDPIIYLPSIGATLAEVDLSVTCQKGFRAIALEKLFQRLRPQ